MSTLSSLTLNFVILTLGSRLPSLRYNLLTSNGSYFFRPSSSGKEGAIVVTMDGEVEDIGVVIEDLLGSVTMVNVLMVGR